MAKWVEFDRDFDFWPPADNRMTIVAYKAGSRVFVPSDHADAAVAANAGRIVEGKKASAEVEVATEPEPVNGEAEKAAASRARRG